MHDRVEVRAHLRDGIATDRQRSLHDQPCLGEHLFAGMPEQQIVGDVTRHTETGEEDHQQNQIELEAQTHENSPKNVQHTRNG